MGTTLIELVKAGVLGFAVAIMVLAYLTLRQLANQLNAPPTALAIIARTIWIYMGLSLAVVIMGIVWHWISPEIQVSIDISPRDISGYDVRVAGESKKSPELKAILLRSGNEIVLELTEFERQINRLRVEIEGLKEQAKEYKRAQQYQVTTEAQRNTETGL